MLSRPPTKENHPRISDQIPSLWEFLRWSIRKSLVPRLQNVHNHVFTDRYQTTPYKFHLTSGCVLCRNALHPGLLRDRWPSALESRRVGT